MCFQDILFCFEKKNGNSMGLPVALFNEKLVKQTTVERYARVLENDFSNLNPSAAAKLIFETKLLWR